MFINLGPGCSYSSILMTGSLTIHLTHYYCSCLKTLEPLNDMFLAHCNETVCLTYWNNLCTSKITPVGRMNLEIMKIPFFDTKKPSTS